MKFGNIAELRDRWVFSGGGSGGVEPVIGFALSWLSKLAIEADTLDEFVARARKELVELEEKVQREPVISQRESYLASILRGRKTVFSNWEKNIAQPLSESFSFTAQYLSENAYIRLEAQGVTMSLDAQENWQIIVPAGFRRVTFERNTDLVRDFFLYSPLGSRFPVYVQWIGKNPFTAVVVGYGKRIGERKDLQNYTWQPKGVHGIW